MLGRRSGLVVSALEHFKDKDIKLVKKDQNSRAINLEVKQ